MLTGVLPFEGPGTLAFIQQHLAAPLPAMKDRAPRARVPEDIEALVQRLLAKQPADRIQKPEQLIEAIDHLAAVHNLVWPGRVSSPSLPAVSRSTKSAPGQPRAPLTQSLDQARAGLTRALGRVRERLFPKPTARDKVGRALDSVGKRLGLRPRRKYPPRAVLVSGAALLAALLIAAIVHALR